MDLVSGHGDRVRPQRRSAEGHLEEALHRVGVKDRVRADAVRQLRHLLDRHNRAGLVVDHHDADEHRVLPQRALQLLQRDASQRVRLQIRDLKAALFQLFHGIEHRVVLDRRGDRMPAARCHPLRAGKDRPVVGLRAAGGEKHALGLRAQRRRDALPRSLQQPRRRNAQPVDGAGIAPVLGERAQRGLHRRLAGAGRRGVIQINHCTSSRIICR